MVSQTNKVGITASNRISGIFKMWWFDYHSQWKQTMIHIFLLPATNPSTIYRCRETNFWLKTLSWNKLRNDSYENGCLKDTVVKEEKKWKNEKHFNVFESISKKIPYFVKQCCKVEPLNKSVFQLILSMMILLQCIQLKDDDVTWCTNNISTTQQPNPHFGLYGFCIFYAVFLFFSVRFCFWQFFFGKFLSSGNSIVRTFLFLFFFLLLQSQVCIDIFVPCVHFAQIIDSIIGNSMGKEKKKFFRSKEQRILRERERENIDWAINWVFITLTFVYSKPYGRTEKCFFWYRSPDLFGKIYFFLLPGRNKHWLFWWWWWWWWHKKLLKRVLNLNSQHALQMQVVRTTVSAQKKRKINNQRNCINRNKSRFWRSFSKKKWERKPETQIEEDGERERKREIRKTKRISQNW